MSWLKNLFGKSEPPQKPESGAPKTVRATKQSSGTKVAKIEPHTRGGECHYCRQHHSKQTPATHDMTLRIRNPQDPANYMYVLIYTCDDCRLSTIQAFGMLEENQS